MSSAEQPSGFYGAPVSKALAMLSVGCSVGLVALDAKPQALLTFTQLERLQWWRLLTVNVAFAGNAEIIVGAMLLYTCRSVERQLGSRKFGAFVALVAVVSTWVHVGALVVCHTGLVPRRLAPPVLFAPGPYAPIFGLLALFHAMIPKLHPAMFSVLGLRFSDKSLTYLLGAQLLGAEGLRSAAPALVGAALGRLYVSPFAKGTLQRLRLPGFVEAIFAAAFPLFASSPPGEAQRRRARAQLARQQQQQQQRGGQPQRGGQQQQQRGGEDQWEQLPGQGQGGAPGFGAAGAPAAQQPAFVAAPPPPEAIESLTVRQPPAAPKQRVRRSHLLRTYALLTPHLPLCNSPLLTPIVQSMGFSRDQVVQALAATDNNVEAAANRLLSG